ncbi:hypothetical protein O185_24215 [Photorhabdus temperata J3]|nr:hypothetical protein O185_24215 [Photorhabdus temperata J3]
MGADIWGNHVINRGKVALNYFEKHYPPGYGFRCVVNSLKAKNANLDLKNSHNNEEILK